MCISLRLHLRRTSQPGFNDIKLNEEEREYAEALQHMNRGSYSVGLQHKENVRLKDGILFATQQK